jgi:CHAD domain-containing protein
VAEPLVGVYGAPLRRFLRRLHGVQALLGDMHDAEQIAQGLSNQLARCGADLPAEAIFAMGRMVEFEQGRVRELQQQIPDAWRQVRGKNWRRLRRALRATVEGETGIAGRG